MKATRLTLTALATVALGGTIYSTTATSRGIERTDFWPDGSHAGIRCPGGAGVQGGDQGIPDSHDP